MKIINWPIMMTPANWIIVPAIALAAVLVVSHFNKNLKAN